MDGRPATRMVGLVLEAVGVGEACVEIGGGTGCHAILLSKADEEYLWEEEDWMEADGSELPYSCREGSCRIGTDQQIRGEVAQNDEATCKESLAECMRPVEGTKMETLQLICDDCEQNKQACIARLEDAKASLSWCFKEADGATVYFDHLRHALAEQEKLFSQQASVYLQQMTSVPSAQYDRDKCQNTVDGDLDSCMAS